MAARRRASSYDPAGDGWHVDRRVNVSFIVAMLFQFGMFVYAWAELRADVTYVKQAVSANQTNWGVANKRLEALTSLQTEMRFHSKSIESLEQTLTGILEYEYRRRSRLNDDNAPKATR